MTGQCSPRHLEILELQKGKLSLFLKPKVLSQELERDPSIKKATVTIRFPHSIDASLEVETRLLPLGFINADRNLLEKAPESSTAASRILEEILLTGTQPTGWYDLTGQGALLSGNQSNVFAIILDQESPSTDRLVTFYRFWLLLEQEGLGWKKLWLSGNHAGVELALGPVAVIDLSGELEKTLTTLQQILSTTTIDLNASVIDLRFRNPVVYQRVN